MRLLLPLLLFLAGCASAPLSAPDNRLTVEHIATLRVNRSTTGDVLDAIGPPQGVTRFARTQRASWTYYVRTTSRMYYVFVTFSADKVVREVFELDEISERD